MSSRNLLNSTALVRCCRLLPIRTFCCVSPGIPLHDLLRRDGTVLRNVVIALATGRLLNSNTATTNSIISPLPRERRPLSDHELRNPTQLFLSMESSTDSLESDSKRDGIAGPASELQVADVVELADLTNTGNNDGPQSLAESKATTETIQLAPDAADPQLAPPLSKKALKRKRRWDEKLAVKKRRKEHAREAKRAKAILDGRDVEKERRDIEERTKEGEGRKRREKVRIVIILAGYVCHVPYSLFLLLLQLILERITSSADKSFQVSDIICR